MQGDKPFIVKSDKALRALPRWLRERGCNSYSFSDDRHISVGCDRNPDSDWGKYTRRGGIVVCDQSLFDETCRTIERTFGWPDRSPSPTEGDADGK